MFGHIQPGPPDPMFTLKKNADNDNSPEKVDLGVGIYRSEVGKYQELAVIRQYESTIGDAEFLRLAAVVMFGEGNVALKSGRISSVQTISGTGANSLGALLISKTMQPKPKVFIGVPTWGNHIPIFKDAGLETTTYPYLDSSKHAVNFAGFLEVVRSAPKGSVFVLQGCCHNPTGVDLSIQQWQELAMEMKAHGHLPFFDTAYQGLGDGLDEDSAGVRVFVASGMELLVCQSFSKNFALYGERCGALHVVGTTEEVAANVQDKLRSLIRHTYSSSPAYGSRLVKIALSNNNMRDNCYGSNVKRNQDKPIDKVQTPGDWSHLTKEKGLFSCLALSPSQCKSLGNTYHVHLPESGRINIAGLSEDNVKRAAKAIDEVIREQG
ncbi:aspartate aminotransferase [Colletotrichum tofieldiae]|nr:aspartate aminotransferase [Colletotrichum tofieldiae]